MEKFKYSSLFVLFFCFSVSLFAQSEAELAKKTFPDETVVNTHSAVTVEFKKSKKHNNSLVAVQSFREEFVNLKNRQKVTYAVFYDDYSSVGTLKGSPDLWVEDTKYQSQDIFHSDMRIKYGTFEMKEFGKKGLFTAEKTFKDLKYLTKVYFPHVYPSLKREIKFIIPDNFDVELSEMNFEGFEIAKQVSKSGGKTHYLYSMSAVDKYSDKSGLPGNSHIYPHILVRPKSYSDNNKKAQYFASTEDLYAWYRLLVKGVDNDSEQLKSLTEEILKDAETDSEKIDKIFYWVQDNIRYIAFEDGLAGYQPENCQTVYNNRYGDCKGMSNLMKNMLILAGFDARLVWLGTRTIAYDYSVPSLATDNHMICAVKRDTGFLYLDATESFINTGNYAERIQGQNVLIENGDNFILEHIPIKSLNQNLRKIDLNLTLNDQKELVGDVQFDLRGEVRSEILYYVNHTPGKKQDELYKAVLKAGEPLNSVSDLEISGDKIEERELIVKGKLTVPNKVSAFDGEYYMYLNPYQYLRNYEFSEDRKYDYWFDYKRNDELNIHFQIPEGFEIVSVPENFNTSDKEYFLDIKYEKADGRIDYKMVIQIPHAVLSQSNMESWNEMIKKLNDHYDQPLILKKS